MSEYRTGLDSFRDEKRFLAELERGVRLANQEIIHRKIPGLDRDTALTFAVTVARLRADYLGAAMAALRPGEGGGPDPSAIEALAGKRTAFVEACEAYEALRHAIERGYIDVAQMGGTETDAA